MCAGFTLFQSQFSRLARAVILTVILWEDWWSVNHKLWTDKCINKCSSIQKILNFLIHLKNAKQYNTSVYFKYQVLEIQQVTHHLFQG